MLNVAVIMGRVVADPELRKTASDISYTRFTLAVDRNFSKGEKQTDFIDVVAWRGTADFVCTYFKKGKLMAVDGTIQTGTYEDKDGNNRKTFEILANSINFADSKQESSSASNPDVTKLNKTSIANENNFAEDDEDSDLPF